MPDAPVPGTLAARAGGTGLVTDVIEFSAVDGPGNRFVVFLQGCNFNCVACHNPYTINLCNDCGDCLATCPSGALTRSEDGRVVWNESICEGGDQCLATCPYDATPKARQRSVDDLLAGIRRAAPFLSGITVSGGEATVQWPFVRALFQAVHAEAATAHLTCFLDSNGHLPTGTWDLLAPVTDGVMVDLKALDDDLHRRLVGETNALTLASIQHLQGLGLLYEVRLLFMAGANDGDNLIRRTAEWLAAIDPHMRVKVIGFRRHGARPSPLLGGEPTAEQRQHYAEILASVAPFSLTVI